MSGGARDGRSPALTSDRERGYEPDAALLTVQAGIAASRDPTETADRRHLRALCAGPSG